MPKVETTISLGKRWDFMEDLEIFGDSAEGKPLEKTYRKDGDYSILLGTS